MTGRRGQHGAWRGSTRGRAGRAARGGFTLVELLVVISIIAIGTTLLVPAFGRLLRSINYSNAVNTVSATLGQARALAIRDRRYTAVAFLFDVASERASVQVLVLDSLAAGSLSQTGGGNVTREAYAYRPATGQVPLLLPRGTAVYGLSFQVDPRNARVNSTTPGWYAGWIQDELNQNERRPLWLAPMNDPRHFTENDPPDVRFHGVDPWEVIAGRETAISESEAARAVRAAQTFVVQFAPDGSVVTIPRSGEAFVPNAYLEWPTAPVDASDPTEDPYDWPDLFDPAVPESPDTTFPTPPGLPARENRTPNPEVFLRSADQLAVVDMTLLGQGTGIQRPWFVRPEETEFPEPAWLERLGYFEADREGARHRLISDWIDENAEVLSFDRYSGKVIRRESP